jgi:HK97 family phage portal protein
MSIIDKILRRTEKEPEKRYSLSDLDRDMDLRITGTPSYSGVNVSESTALNYAPVFTCVRILAETVAKVPFEFYRRIPRGKERAIDHPLYSIIHDVANPEMASYQFRETLQGHLGTWGNAYAEIQWGPDGNVVALWPLRPDKMIDIIRKEDGKLWYQYRLPDKYNKEVLLPSYRVLHIPFMGYNGVSGYSPISLARQTIGLGMAVEKFGSTFFQNGSRPSGVITLPTGQTMKKEVGERVRSSWEAMYQGLDNAHRTAILEDGMDFKVIGIPPEDAQFLLTGNFSARQVAAWYGIPPNKVGAELTTGTYSNIEAQGIDFVNDVMPWFRRWESRYCLKLLGPDERREYFAEFSLNGLMRGDAVARAAYQTAMFGIGKYSINDLRSIDNENPVDDPMADEHFVSYNMIPISKADGTVMLRPEPTGNPLPQPVQKKSERSEDRIYQALSPVFRQAAQEIVDKEARDIERAKKRPDFATWLRDYYNTLPEAIEKRMASPVEALASIHPEISAATIQGHLRASAKRYAETNQIILEGGKEIDFKEAAKSLADCCQNLPTA